MESAILRTADWDRFALMHKFSASLRHSAGGGANEFVFERVDHSINFDWG
jgi:hypothetical protein